MSTLDLSKDSKRRPVELVSDVALSEDAVEMLAESPNTLSYIRALCEREMFDDALLTLARTLPKQYAIVWAAKCVEDAVSGELQFQDRACFDLARKWLNGPNEKLRRAAMEAAEERDFDGQYAWLAAAVGFSGGSLAPANQAEVPPPQNLTAVAVSACLLSLASQNDEEFVEKANQIIDRGLAMAAIPGS